MADIEDKLGKSLDDLIKEASKKRQGHGGSGGRGPGRRSASAGGKRLRRSGKGNDEDMEVDGGGGGGSALGATGGVGKKRYSGGSLQIKSAPKQVSIDVPKGNINGQWKHDLHHQLKDDGPARTRKFNGKANRKPDVLRVIELSKVPMAVSVEDITDLCETVVKIEDVLHVEGKQIGRSLKMTIEFSSESAASIFFQKYRDIVLDGVPLDVKQRGMSVPTVLRSGITVSTKQQSARRQSDGSGAPRGRGQSGRMRSDRMDE